MIPKILTKEHFWVRFIPLLFLLPCPTYQLNLLSSIFLIYPLTLLPTRHFSKVVLGTEPLSFQQLPFPSILPSISRQSFFSALQRLFRLDYRQVPVNSYGLGLVHRSSYFLQSFFHLYLLFSFTNVRIAMAM